MTLTLQDVTNQIKAEREVVRAERETARKREEMAEADPDLGIDLNEESGAVDGPLHKIQIWFEGPCPYYAMYSKRVKTVLPVSDFVMWPTAVIKLNGDEAQTVFQVRVFAFGHDAVEGEEHQISAALFSSSNALKKWCNQRRLSWQGDQDAADALYVRLNGAKVPELKGVTTTGLHDNVFVLEDKVIGGDGYAYVKPKMYLQREVQVHEYPGFLDFGNDGRQAVITFKDESEAIPTLIEWDRGLRSLSRLHNADVITPILGWMAMAPLRSMFSKFPILGLQGGSGWGKTTILENVLSSFGFHAEAIAMKGATRYGVLAATSGTNAFPVFFDEYRGSIRSEAKDCVDQAVRDAYDGSSSPRGGVNADNLSEVTAVKISAPLIVAGEDRFTAQSHVERTVLIDIPKDGRNVSALSIVDTDEMRSALQMFFGLYLQWLLYLKAYGMLGVLPRRYDRQEHGRAVAEYGYNLLRTFCGLVGLSADVLPKWDISRVAAGQSEHVDIWDELLDDAVGAVDSDDHVIVFDADGYRYVRCAAFVEWCRKNRADADMPGGAQAISKLLQEKYGAKAYTTPARVPSGWRARCVRWPLPSESVEEL